jgi:predicted AlkP superfamily phosphohydrolase/phosphomutase
MKFYINVIRAKHENICQKSGKVFSSFTQNRKRKSLNKVILLGLDGTTFTVLEPLVNNGKLPNLAKLMREGTYGTLHSTVPCLSIPALPVLCTGVNPAKLGIFGFEKQDGSIVTYDDVKQSTLWDVLAEYDVKSCVVNVTGTYPPVLKNGIMIAGSAPSEQNEYVYPNERKSAATGFYSEFDLLKKLTPRKQSSKYLDLATTIELKRWEIFRRVMQGQEYGLGILWMVLSDDMQHYYWGCEDILTQFYQTLDKIVGQLLESFAEYNIIILSDHGFEAKPSSWFFANSWLNKMGYLRMKSGKLSNYFALQISAALRKAWEGAPERIRQLALKWSHSQSPSHSGDESNEPSANRFLFGVNWENTIAYMDSFTWGIRVRTRDQGSYAATRAAIIAGLQGLRDDRGNSVVRGAWNREELFSGDHLSEVPDIVLLTNGDFRATPFMSTSGQVTASIRASRWNNFRGDHNNARDAIFIGYGPVFKRGYRMPDIEITDVAPTVLHIMGFDVPSNMDGRVRTDILETNSEPFKRAVRLRQYGAEVESKGGVTEEETELIKKRLKALGYID